MHLQTATYDLAGLAIVGGALFIALCAFVAFVLLRWRAAMRGLEVRNEELSDRNWELREAEERARSLLDAQGDVIVRRDGSGHITYANDAFCTLVGKPHAALIGSNLELPVLEQGT